MEINTRSEMSKPTNGEKYKRIKAISYYYVTAFHSLMEKKSLLRNESQQETNKETQRKRLLNERMCQIKQRCAMPQTAFGFGFSMKLQCWWRAESMRCVTLGV